MAIKDTIKDDVLHLAVDNGDLTKIDELMKNWNFKDYQSLIRFAISILIVTEDKHIEIKKNGTYTQITPASHLLKQNEADHGNK